MFDEKHICRASEDSDLRGIDVVLADGTETGTAWGAGLPLSFLPALEPGSKMIFRFGGNGLSTPSEEGADETIDMPCIVPCFAGWLVRKSTGERYPLPESMPITVGRSDECVVAIGENRTVSRMHALIRCKGGACFVEDLGSRNGTLVDGALLEPRSNAAVPFGSILRLGSEHLRLEEGTCSRCLADGAPMGCMRRG